MALTIVEWLVIVGISLGSTFLSLYGVLRWLNQRIVKTGMSLMGSLGGDAKAVKGAENKMAKEFINKNYGLIKIAADKFLGVDVDEILEDYGAANVMSALVNFGNKMGIDINSILANPEALMAGLGKGLNPQGNTGNKQWYE